MTREQVEAAIIELDGMLDRDSEREEDYQQWFESHPLVFIALGYIRSIPHPHFIAPSGEEFIPDFLVQRPNGVWEIFEIKTPQAAILRDRERRSTFYASFEQYLSQCHEYAEVLDDVTTREAAQQRYEISLLNKRPTSVLVAGRNQGIDFGKLSALSQRRTPPVTVFTYDDVRTALESYRTFNFGAYDNAQGVSLFATLVIRQPNIPNLKNYIFDWGTLSDRDRISVYIDEKVFLCLTVWDSHGHQHHAHSSEPLSQSDYNVPLWFEFEVGVCERFGFISIQMDYKYRADIRINNFPLGVSDAYVLGSDWHTEGHSWFLANEIMVYARPLRFDEKRQLREYAEERRRLICSGEADRWVEFLGHKFMYSQSHPAAQRDGTNAAAAELPSSTQ